MIRDGHAMGIAAEITQHLYGPAEGGLGVDDPIVAMQSSQKFSELLRVGQSGCRAGAAKLVATVKAFQTGEELAAKHAAQHFHR